MGDLIREVGRAFRAQKRAPATALLIVATLGVGLGSSTAVFSALHTALLPSYPFVDPERLAVIGAATEDGTDRLTVPDVLALRETRSAEAIAAHRPASFNLTGVDLPERVAGAYVTPNFFDLLGVHPNRGSGFAPLDEHAGGRRRAVVTHAFSRRFLGGDDTALQQTLTLDGEPYEVAGVLPVEFWFPNDAEVWVASGADESYTTPSETRRIYRVIARLRPGTSPTVAQQEMNASLVDGGDPDDLGITVTAFRQGVVGGSERVLLMLQLAAALLLLLGLINAAGLLLARSLDRQHENRLRVALGAGALALARSVLMESALLAVAAGVFGAVLATSLLEVLPSLVTVEFAGPASLGIDAVAISFCFASALGAGALMSVVPGILAARAAGRVSAGNPRWSTTSRRDRRWHHGLLAVQVATALVLAAGAGSVTRTLLTLLSQDPGFDHRGVITMRLSLAGDRYPDRQSIAAFYHELAQTVAAMPRIQTAGVTLALPFSGTNIALPVEVSGGGADPVSIDAHFRTVAARYFETLRIPLREGRLAFDRATPANAREAVVSEAVSRRLGRSPLGERLRLDPDSDEFFEVVGVVGDVRHFELGRPAEPEIYLGYESYPMNWGYLVARTSGRPADLVASIRRTVATMDAEQPVYSIASLDDLVDQSTGPQRFVALLVLVFAASALSIVAAGVYGSVAGHVARLTRELGIRAAMGATRRSLTVYAGKGIVTVVGAGAAAGLWIGVWGGRALAARLPEAPALGASALGVAVVAIAITTGLAAYGPARRASRVDPVTVLAGD